MSNGYFEFGVNKPIETKFTDPVDLCLANNFFNLKDNPLVQGDATLCNNYMVQRCAKGWDDKCKLFFNQNIDPTFLLEVAKYKYCTLDPKSNCWEVCKPMNPLAQSSPNVCKVYGNQFYVKDSELYDLAGNFSLTSKLRNTSPVTFTKCPVLCQGVEKIEAKDPVMDACLATGQCQEVLQNLAIYASENNLPVAHEKFREFMNSYIMNKAPIVPANEVAPPTSYKMPSRFSNNYVTESDKVSQPSITTTDIKPVKLGFADPTTSQPDGSKDDSNVVLIANCGDIGKSHWLVMLGIFIIIVLILIHLYKSDMK